MLEDWVKGGGWARNGDGIVKAEIIGFGRNGEWFTSNVEGHGDAGLLDEVVLIVNPKSALAAAVGSRVGKQNGRFRPCLSLRAN